MIFLVFQLNFSFLNSINSGHNRLKQKRQKLRLYLNRRMQMGNDKVDQKRDIEVQHLNQNDAFEERMSTIDVTTQPQGRLSLGYFPQH